MTTTTFDRAQIRAWIELATGEGLSVSDALPDTLAATAEALGLDPTDLRLWIFDHQVASFGGELMSGSTRPASEWTTAALVEWARRYGLARNEHSEDTPESVAEKAAFARRVGEMFSEAGE